VSNEAQTWVIRHSQHRGAAYTVLLMIANHANPQGENSFPSVPTLAFEARVSERQVTRVLPELEASGELVIVARKSGQGNRLRFSLPHVRPWVESQQGEKRGRGRPPKGDMVSPFKPLNPDMVSPLKGDMVSSKGDIHATKDDIRTPEARVNPFNQKEPRERRAPARDGINNFETTEPSTANGVPGGMVPRDFGPSPQTVEWVKGEYPQVDIAREVAAFVDHYVTNGRQALDWDAMFRSWVRKVPVFGGIGGGGTNGNGTHGAREATGAVRADQAGGAKASRSPRGDELRRLKEEAFERRFGKRAPEPPESG
jgi:hypothetical protein